VVCNHDQQPVFDEDVAILAEDEMSRNCWEKGDIIHVNLGIYMRPVSELIVLEVGEEATCGNLPGSN
jgi:hypothetical protein